MNSKLGQKVLSATKWSVITEIIAKVITPITNMILARLLIPESFGIVATVSMIISFVDMFTDSGFQKYLVQQEFETNKEKSEYANIAFWTNLIISLIFLLIILLYSEQLANLLGSPEIGRAIQISALSLPLTSFSSIQMALYRRDFEYKTLFYVRIVGILIPFFITIPLALLYRNYWSLIIGTICGQLANAVILTIQSKWKPSKYFCLYKLKKMISFSSWSLIEAISIWFTTWIDTFIVGSMISSYYLGIYRTGINTVNGVMSIITATTTGIIFSGLSRLQGNNLEFNQFFLKSQKLIGYLVLPMGVGIYLYRDLITIIMLGENWGEAKNLIGFWGLTSALVIVLGHYCSEVYRAKGLPKISFTVQILHLIILVPVCYISAKYSFVSLVFYRSLVRLQIILVHMIYLYRVTSITPFIIIKNLKYPLIATIFMGILSIYLRHISQDFWWSILTVGISIIAYVILVLLLQPIYIYYLKKILLGKKKSLNQIKL